MLSCDGLDCMLSKKGNQVKMRSLGQDNIAGVLIIKKGGNLDTERERDTQRGKTM